MKERIKKVKAGSTSNKLDLFVYVQLKAQALESSMSHFEFYLSHLLAV